MKSIQLSGSFQSKNKNKQIFHRLHYVYFYFRLQSDDSQFCIYATRQENKRKVSLKIRALINYVRYSSVDYTLYEMDYMKWFFQFVYAMWCRKKKINLAEIIQRKYLLDIFLYELVKIKVKNLWNSRSNNISNKNMDVGDKNNDSALTYKSFTL